MTEEKGNAKDPGQELLKEACKAYGIGREFVFSSRYYPDTGKVVIVTNGGAKVSYQKGDSVERLDPVRVDGVSRKKPKIIAGKKR